MRIPDHPSISELLSSQQQGEPIANPSEGGTTIPHAISAIRQLGRSREHNATLNDRDIKPK